MRNDERIEELTEGLRYRGGKGNFNGDLMLVFERKNFKDAGFVRQLMNELGIDGDDVYATCFRKDHKADDDYLREIVQAEFGIVKPKTMWLVGDKVRELMDVDVPLQVGYGRYTPIYVNSCKALIVPKESEVSMMPDDIKIEFFNRMKEFATEYNADEFEIPNLRIAEVAFLKKFADENGYDYDESLRTPKSFWFMFSNKVSKYVTVVQSQADKEVLAEQIPFGIVVTENEMRDFTEEEANFLFKVMKMFGSNKIEERIG